MRSHWANAMFGVLDYLVYPLGMLLLAPVILHALGVERFGVWVMASATLSTGAVLASGFGDANTRSIAMSIGAERREQLLSTVRSTLGIHLTLGIVVATIGWAAAPALMRAVVKTPGEMRLDCLWALRLAAVLMLVRAIETVCVSTQRAFSRYGSAIQISVAARVLSLAAAGIVPIFSQTVRAVMIATLIITVLGLAVQIVQLKSLLGISRLVPLFHFESAKALFRFGIFTWLQSVAGLLFGQVDRIIAGVMFGAALVTPYALCAQIAQPVYGITAAGLHFLFPHVALRMTEGSIASVRRSVLCAFVANLIFVSIALGVLLLFGKDILRIWAGQSIAQDSVALLPAIAWSSALSALGVTGCYSLLALGRPRSVTTFNMIGGLMMIVAISILVSHYGLAGIAYGRLFFGPIVLLVYLPLFSMLKRPSLEPAMEIELPICEEV